MSFLTAEWRKLAFANYSIDKELLKDYVPAGTELDLWNGTCFVSLIGFLFKNTRVLGVKVPFHINFQEVNLRFYVKRFENGHWKRGTVFIREFVPTSKIALTVVTNLLYKEHYSALPMAYNWIESENQRQISYQWKKNKKWQHFQVRAGKAKIPIEKNSETEFITEHYWGFAKVGEKHANEYQVAHPRWEIYKIDDFEIDVDFEANYDQKFAFLNKQKPGSVMLAEGSAITIEKKRKIIPNGFIN